MMNPPRLHIPYVTTVTSNDGNTTHELKNITNSKHDLILLQWLDHAQTCSHCLILAKQLFNKGEQ